MPQMSILDEYVNSNPNAQNALDIFSGEWSSKLPAPHDTLVAGRILLFEDPRVEWAINQLGGVENRQVVELGPLEGAHTFMLEKSGAANILSIEANTRAFLKCLITKEIFSLEKAHFILGDFVKYLRNPDREFDICFACGVLYHMTNPLELLSLISTSAEQVFIWTHYYDPEIINHRPSLRRKFINSSQVEYDGFSCTFHWQKYEDALNWAGFCGGSQPKSAWMQKEDILEFLDYLGYGQFMIGFEEPNHVNGPAFALTCTAIR